jgi:hypothetical protein
MTPAVAEIGAFILKSGQFDAGSVRFVARWVPGSHGASTI